MLFSKHLYYKGIKFTLRKQWIVSTTELAIYSARTKFGICTIEQECFLGGKGWKFYSGMNLVGFERKSSSFSAAARKEISFLRFIQEKKEKDKKFKTLIASAKAKLTKAEWSSLKEKYAIR